MAIEKHYTLGTPSEEDDALMEAYRKLNTYIKYIFTNYDIVETSPFKAKKLLSTNIPFYYSMGGAISIFNISREVSDYIMNELNHMKSEIEGYLDNRFIFKCSQDINPGKNNLLIRLIPNKNLKYLNMSKDEIQSEIDKALDNNDYDKVGQLSKYLKEGLKHIKSYRLF